MPDARVTTARSLLLSAPHRLEWREEHLPAVGAGDVRVETVAGAVSVGTELPLYRGTARSAERPFYPRMTGYESLGRVEEVGPDVATLAVGDLVLAPYGHRTATCLPERRFIPVPQGIPAEIALLAILSCDVSKGVAKLELSPHDAVLITGAGTVALLALHRLLWLGLKGVDVLEPDPARRELARALGAREVWAPGAFPEAPAPEARYDAGLECSSRNAAFETLQGSLRHGGRLCVLADGNLEPLVLTPAFHERELAVVGSSDGADYPGHAQAFFSRWLETRPPLERLFEWRVHASELAEAFARMASGAPPVKVFVDYRE